VIKAEFSASLLQSSVT